MAAVTHESIPPLSSTTALRASFIASDAPHRRIPNELVELQSQPHEQSAFQNPFGEHTRAHALPFPSRVLKYRSEQYLPNAGVQPMLARELARDLVVTTRRNHKL